ncbi:unnamed protein product, partial [Rotaria magnacalcarata]
YSLIQRWYNRLNQSLIDFYQIKLFTFLIFRALVYLHARGIAHRDIKSSTDSNDQLLRLILLLGEPNVDEVRNMKSKSDQIIYQQIRRKISLIDQSAKMIEHLTC